MRYMKDLEMSSTNMLPKEVLADALSGACCLQTLSLRYVATDDVLRALAGSVAAKESLRLVDISFSSNVTDQSCEDLVNAAPHLERLNLRACSSISASCYNTVPVELQQRKTRTDDSEQKLFSISKIPAFHNRKGDNIFYFAGSTP
jgi:hypothetical protein